MSLAQTYRSRVAARQNRQLLGYLALAVTVHAAGAVGWAIWHPQTWLNELAQTEHSPTPIEFVAIEPKPQPSQPPAVTDRRAQTNTIAGGTPDAKLSIQSGSSQPSDSAAVTPVAPRPAPNRSSSTPARSPVDANRPVPPRPSPALTPDAISLSSPTPLASPSPPSPPSPSPSLTPPSTATQLGSPLTHSISIDGQGVDEPLNPNRAAAGSGVDAVEDDVWGTYLNTLNRTIDQNWQRVSVAATRRTKIQFRVDRQGRLRDLQVVQSSGDLLADQAALQAIRAAAPFAPLPQNAAEDVLIVNFTFTQWLLPASP